MSLLPGQTVIFYAPFCHRQVEAVREVPLDTHVLAVSTLA